MQLQHHVNAPNPGNWARTKGVALYNGWIVCVLDHDRVYSFADAYRYAPHVKFLNLKTDLDLARFVRTYGPLYPPGSDELRVRQEETKLWWSFQRRLKARVNLLEAFRRSKTDPDRLRGALLEHLRVNLDEWKDHPGLSHWGFICGQLSVTQEPEEWVSQAGLPLIRDAASYCIRRSFSFRVALQATWKDRRPELLAAPEALILLEALEWMVCEDEVRRHPLLFCQECGTAFRPPTRHARKFCSYDCAHRVAARKWRRRDLRQKRKRS